MKHEQFADPVESANTMAEFRRVLALEINPVTWGSLGVALEEGRVKDFNLGMWVPSIWSAESVRDIRMKWQQKGQER